MSDTETNGSKPRRPEAPGLSLPWIVTALGGGVISVAGFLAKAEFGRLTTATEGSTRATVELRSEMRDGLGAVRIELVSLQARQTRGDEIAAETRQEVRELATRNRTLEDLCRGLQERVRQLEEHRAPR